MDEELRLNRYLAAAGHGSRRGVESLVGAGRVTVNGVVERSPGRRIGPRDEVEVDGAPATPQRHAYVLLHKPAGVVTTARDPQGRPTVVEAVGGEQRLFPVGRLDRATTGALLLTNDGELAHRLMHPRHGVEKTYDALVEGQVGEQALTRLRGGVPLDGRDTAPADVQVVERGRGQTRLRLVLHEGRNRQVRRMCEAVGHPVVALHRPRYAGLTLDGLAPGQARSLTPAEVEALRRA